MKQLAVTDVKHAGSRDAGAPLLLDVREPWECELAAIRAAGRDHAEPADGPGAAAPGRAGPGAAHPLHLPSRHAIGAGRRIPASAPASTRSTTSPAASTPGRRRSTRPCRATDARTSRAFPRTHHACRAPSARRSPLPPSRSRWRLALAGTARAQSLQELYEAARGYDATYLAARALADSAQYRAEQAKALNRPQVGLQVAAHAQRPATRPTPAR